MLRFTIQQFVDENLYFCRKFKQLFGVSWKPGRKLPSEFQNLSLEFRRNKFSSEGNYRIQTRKGLKLHGNGRSLEHSYEFCSKFNRRVPAHNSTQTCGFCSEFHPKIKSGFFWRSTIFITVLVTRYSKICSEQWCKKSTTFITPQVILHIISQ